MIDEFLVSARGKWGLRPSLVLLLPHGHEGQGPDHASARPERFLQLAADINMRIANCTTAAQYFHLLRRQAALLTIDPLPLIVLTPKSLLRHPLVASAPREFAEGRFRMVIPDADADARAPRDPPRAGLLGQGVRGPDGERASRGTRPDVAICRLEQLYPVPDARSSCDARRLSRGRRRSSGSRKSRRTWAPGISSVRISSRSRARARCARVARPRSASPAEGSAARHATNQQTPRRQGFRRRARWRDCEEGAR